MRTPVIAASLTLLAFSALPAHAAAKPSAEGADAAAQPAGPPPAPPRLFEAAGYSQPDITPGLCQTVSAKEVRCTIPRMTVGRYLIVAQGDSTATGPDAAKQALDIRIDAGGEEKVCARGETPPTPKDGKPWTTGPRFIKIACMATFISDDPMVVRATYADVHATADSKGPLLAFRRLPWNPVLSLGQAAFVQPQQAPAGGGK